MFDFYRLVYPKLVAQLKIPFRLESNARRIDETQVHEAVREALINALIHADYSGRVGIVILKKPGWFEFRNPGELRLPVDIVLEGGMSDCRNRNLQKMFQLIGLSEQAGSGIPKIFGAWREQHWRKPFVEEFPQTEHTEWRLPMVSLLPDDILAELDRLFEGKFRHLPTPERLALATACIEGKITNQRLQEITDLHPRDITTLLHGLVDRQFLLSKGIGRGTFYLLRTEQLIHPIPLPFLEDQGSVNSVHLETGSGSSFEHLGTDSEHLETDSGVSSVHLGTDSGVSSVHLDEKSDAQSAMVELVKTSGKINQEYVQQAILYLCEKDFVTLHDLAKELNRAPTTLRTHYLSELIQQGRLIMRYPDKPNHPNQAYRVPD